MAEANVAADTDTGTETPTPPARKLMMIIVGVGIAVGGAAGALIAGPVIARKVVGSGTAAKPADAHGASGKKDEKKEEKSDEKDAEQATILVDNLVLNPAGSGGLRFLLVTVGIQVGSAATSERMKKRDAEVRDVVLRVLGAKKVEELAEIANREGIKTEITSAIDALFGAHTVRGVYFPQFVIQ